MSDHTTLTDAEREALAGAFADHWLSLMDSDDANLMADSPEVTEEAALHAQVVHAAVEHIIAARADEARADERERIAQAIEGKYLGPDSGRSHDGREAPDAALRNAYDEGLEVAACIARDEAECPECGHGTADGRLACGPDCDQGRIAREGADR